MNLLPAFCLLCDGEESPGKPASPLFLALWKTESQARARVWEGRDARNRKRESEKHCPGHDYTRGAATASTTCPKSACSPRQNAWA